METTKIIIAGGRDFNDYELLKKSVDEFILFYLQMEPNDPVEIVSGGAPGADSLGERYASENGYPIKKFPADWNTHGKAAGPIRNRQMASYAHACIIFWDGKSRGTKNMIEEAKKKNLLLHIVKYTYDKI